MARAAPTSCRVHAQQILGLVNTAIRNFDYMKRIYSLALPLLFFFCLPQVVRGQYQQVNIGVNGLTCSQCSRTVELSLRKLDFVADVDMNLQHTEGRITFKKNSRPDMDRIAQAVVDAGFSVRYLTADLADLGSHAAMIEKDRFELDHNLYVFTEAPAGSITGHVQLKFLGKKFLPKNEYRKMESLLDKAGNVQHTPGKVYIVQMVPALNP